MKDVIIVGAGLAGLTCARRLTEGRVPCRVLEAADVVGGRVATEVVDGFQLDRGFQVVLSSYSEIERWVDLAALGAGYFEPGARVWLGDGRWCRVSDPKRRPWRMLGSLLAPIGTLGDKLRVAQWSHRARHEKEDAMWKVPEGQTAIEALRARGFSELMIERFWRPWFGGVFLERELSTPARMMEFVFRAFASGHAVLPAGGMQRVAEALARPLPAGCVELRRRVVRVAPGEVELEGGEVRRAREIVVATDGTTAARLLGERVPAPAWRSTTCVYFVAPKSPLRGKRELVLNGSGQGRVNSVVVPSDIASGYVPEESTDALVSVALIGDIDTESDALAAAVQAEVRAWFGAEVDKWRPLAVTRVRQALPVREPLVRPVVAPLRPGLWVAGDHRGTASIQGAMASGRAVAEAIFLPR